MSSKTTEETDVMSKALDEFYDDLYIYTLLQARILRRIKDGRTRRPVKITTPRSEWQMLLDSICLLCDTHRGGTTTIAIAIENLDGQAVVWAATPKRNTTQLQEYIARLLEKVRHVSEADSSERLAFSRDICRVAVQRSPQRVQNYAAKLRRAVNELCSIISNTSGTNEQGCIAQMASLTTQKLRELLTDPSDHVALCVKAHNFRTTDSFKFIRAQCKQGQYDAYYRAQHYIGRLASWSKAAEDVTALAPAFGQIWTDCKVRVLSTCSMTGQAPSAFTQPFHQVLQRLVPNHLRSSHFTDVMDRLYTEISSELPLRRRPSQTRAHVETVLLWRFHSQRLPFLWNDRYIGCSKPSCYCCRAYFAAHATGAQTGRTHGNVWLKWCLPRDKGDLRRDSLATDDVEILRRMADTLHEDVLAALLKQDAVPLTVFDSTSGTSTSAMRPLANVE